MRSLVQGTNSNHWVHPYQRDTTRGEVFGGTSGTSLHTKDMKATIQLAACGCCGVTFGYPPGEKKRPEFCPSHDWIKRTSLLGFPSLTRIEYDDCGTMIVGEGIKWSYFIPETNQRDVLTLRNGIREWLNEEYLEKMGLGRLPKVVVTEKGLVVTDLQRIAYGNTPGGRDAVDYRLLAKAFLKIDQIYVEVL